MYKHRKHNEKLYEAQTQSWYGNLKEDMLVQFFADSCI